MTPAEQTAFHAERSTGIGGSDIASVFNLSYGCTRRLAYDKCGAVPDFPDEESGPMKLGKVLEPFFAGEYEKKTQRKLTENARAIHHPKHRELLVHIDRREFAQERAEDGVLEIKALGRGMYAKVKREGMPDDYTLQLLHGMLCTGLQWGSFAVGNRDNGDLMHWDMDRSDALCDDIKDASLEFWRQVPAWKARLATPGFQAEQGSDLPARLDPDDKRCWSCRYRRTCQGGALLPPKGELEEAPELMPLLKEYDERKALKDEAVSLYDETRDVLRERIGDRTAVAVGRRKVYYRTQKAGGSWDFEKLGRQYNDARKKLAATGEVLPEFDSFYEAGTSRPLRIY